MTGENLPEKTEVLKPEEQLEAILYQFVNLYERWSEDRQAAAKQGAELNKLVKNFSEEVINFKQLESNVKSQIRDSILNAGTTVTKSIGNQIKADAQEAIKEASATLSKAVQQTQQTLAEAGNEVNGGLWRLVFGSFFCAILTALLILWFFIPSRIVMDNDFKNAIADGVRYEKFWPKLNNAQQQWLIDLSEGRVKNHGKEIDALREQYPDMDSHSIEAMSGSG